MTTGALTLDITATGSAGADATQNPAMPGRVLADRDVFATRDVTELPPPTGDDEDSFDEIHHFTNGAAGQLDVAEAAPGVHNFKGGRWSVTVLEQTIDDPPVVMSGDAIHAHSADISVIEEGARYTMAGRNPMTSVAG